MFDKLLKRDNTQRNSKMDVLRIVAMLFIVIEHLATVSLGRLEDVEDFVLAESVPMHMVSSLIVCFAVIGVNLFFLLSGYFEINFKPGKALQLVIKVYIYWILGALLAMACGFKTFENAWEAVKFMVIGISKYWFILMYLLLMICAPLLNKLADKLFDGDGKCGYFVFVTLLFFAVIGFIADYFYPIMGTNGGYSVIWAGTVYMYGRLIRKRESRLKKNAKRYLLIYVLLSIANYAIVAPLIATGVGNSNGRVAYLFLNYNNPLVFFASLSFFMMFVSLKPIKNQKLSKAVSFIAVHTLAVYLWHSENAFLKETRAFLMMAVEPFWAKLLLLLPNALLLFAFGVAMDIAYDFLLSRPLARFCDLIDGLMLKAATKICKLFDRAICVSGGKDAPLDDVDCDSDNAQIDVCDAKNGAINSCLCNDERNFIDDVSPADGDAAGAENDVARQAVDEDDIDADGGDKK